MLKMMLLHGIRRFETTWGYDASYMRRILSAAPASLLRFSVLAKMVDGRAAPAAALAAAGLAGTLAEDCGPCTQLSADMAAAQGVPASELQAIVSGDEAAMGPDARLAWRFARASLARDLETSETLRDEVVRRWGERGLVAIALRLTTARMYPTLKYALGHGQACSRVRVGGQEAVVARARMAA